MFGYLLQMAMKSDGPRGCDYLNHAQSHLLSRLLLKKRKGRKKKSQYTLQNKSWK